MNLSLDIYVFLLKFEKRHSYLADLAGDNTAYSPLLFLTKSSSTIECPHWVLFLYQSLTFYLNIS